MFANGTRIAGYNAFAKSDLESPESGGAGPEAKISGGIDSIFAF